MACAVTWWYFLMICIIICVRHEQTVIPVIPNITYKWSGRLDLNQRPLAPKASALNHAAPRPEQRKHTIL